MLLSESILEDDTKKWAFVSSLARISASHPTTGISQKDKPRNGRVTVEFFFSGTSCPAITTAVALVEAAAGAMEPTRPAFRRSALGCAVYYPFLLPIPTHTVDDGYKYRIMRKMAQPLGPIPKLILSLDGEESASIERRVYENISTRSFHFEAVVFVVCTPWFAI